MKLSIALAAALLSTLATSLPQYQTSNTKSETSSSYPSTEDSINGVHYKTDLAKNEDGTYTGTITAVAKSYKDCSSLRSWASTEKSSGFCDGLKIYDSETRRSYKGDCISGYNGVADSCIRYFDVNHGTGSYDFKYVFTGKITETGKPSTSNSDFTKPWREPYYDVRQDYVDLSIRAKSVDQCKYIEAYGTKPDHSGFCDGLPGTADGFEKCVKTLHEITGYCEEIFKEGKYPEYSITLGITASKFPEWAKKFPKKYDESNQ
ncbi:hypothetical protein HDU97_002177 [Phlyctochytrium planicorne]|nr:hypothetical protein HDU97_002177 [Phlyctochytrium planicorne]